MNPVGILIIYILWWWLIFFAVLPLGIKGRWESPDDGVKGADPGAPANPDLKRKVKLTSLIALGFTVVTIIIIVSGIFKYSE